LRHLDCRQRAPAEETLCVARGAPTTAIATQNHIGTDITHQAPIRVARAYTGVHWGDQSVSVVAGGMDAVAHAEVEMDSVLKVVVSIEAQSGDRGVGAEVTGGFNGLEAPAVGVGEIGGHRWRHADRDITALKIRSERFTVLGNPDWVEYPVPTQLGRIDEGIAGNGGGGVGPEAAIGIGNIEVGFHESLVRRLADAAHAAPEIAAIVEVQLEIGVLRGGAAVFDLRERFDIARPL